MICEEWCGVYIENYMEDIFFCQDMEDILLKI